MNYDFIRKLAVKVSEEKAGAIVKLLLSHNIETFAEGTKEDKAQGRMYVAAEAGTVRGELYVAAADRAQAIELLEAGGYGDLICRDEQEAAVLSETEMAMQEYYRRRRQNNLITLAVVVAAFLFFFLRGVLGQ